MKTNPLKSLYGLAAVATALTGSALSQEGPETQGERPSMIDRAIRQALSEMEEGSIPPDASAESPDQWRIGLVVGPVDPVLRIHLNLPDGAGVMVSKVLEGSPAANAGIAENDIIVAAGDRKINSLETLKMLVGQAGKNDKPLTLSVLQKGKLNQIKITRMPPPQAPEARKPDQSDRPAGNMMSMMWEQNRRFEEMRGTIQEMSRQLQQQQQQIDALSNKLSDRDAQPRDQRRKKARPAGKNDESSTVAPE